MVKNSPKSNEVRTLNISNFRNLGVHASNKKSDARTYLKVNRGLEFDDLGGLVLLLGLNNSGKSNIIDAIEKFKNNKFDENDIPDFIIQDEKLIPKVSVNVANGKYNQTTGTAASEYLISRMNSPEMLQRYIGIKNKPVPVDNQYDFTNMTNFVISILRSFMASRALQNGHEPYMLVLKVLFEKDEEFRKIYESADKITELLGDVRKNADDLIFFLGCTEVDGRMEFFKKYGYLISYYIYRYEQKRIRQTDLECRPTAFNEFFINLMEILGISQESLSEVYKKSRVGLRKQIEKECNDKLEEISNTFNNIFTADPENRYRFEVLFETNHLYFTIHRGDIPLANIDRQSEGFRWIFDFYFNFIMKETFKPGDMVLMDEFGFKLNPKSVKEIGSMLRDYAKETGLTFVIATQAFMIVDINHLDETRLVINESNGNTKIINEFDNFDNKNRDVMRPLLDCLTISRNFMRTEGRNTIFVEGMSDYFFLTAFAEMMRRKGSAIDVDFISVNGLGKTDTNLKETVKTLLSIEPNPIILTDSDGRAKKFKEMAKNDTLSVLILSSVMENEKMVNIEDLFSKKDRERFRIDEKSFDINACFAQSIQAIYPTLEDETKINFEKLIDNITLG
jgi:Asp-tRNA(Asn)/Glu-tRNA(Gln) amidotransferase C subunit